MTATTEMLAHSYWRHAQTARHPTVEFARAAQAMLWGLATSERVPDRIRNAALRHLSVVEEFDTVITVGGDEGREWQ